MCNTLSAGDTVLVLRAGKFGERWEEICRSLRRHRDPDGRSLRPDGPDVDRRGRPAPASGSQGGADAAQRVVHRACSTTSEGIAAVTRATGAILIVDAVSSLGIADLRMDAWGVDAVVAGSQKGLMLPPGLSFCALSDKAWGHVKASRLPKYYFDIATERKFVARNEGALHAGRVHRRGAARGAAACSRRRA